MDRNADREHQQGGDIGEHRCTNGHRDCLVTQLAKLLHDWERDQGMGGEEGPNDERPDPRVTGPEPYEKARRQRKREREEPEADGPVTSPVELHQIDFQSGKEHQQELAKLGKEINNRAVPGGEPQAERADQHSGRHQPDHPRQPNPAAQRWDGEQDQHGDGESREGW